MEEKKIKVYIKIDNYKNIIECNSEIFIDDFTNWIEIDKGYGDKYAHCQLNYFEHDLVDENGEYNYSYINKKIVLK